MSIPQRARDLRKAFDAQNFFTAYTPGVRGFSHQLRVLIPKTGNYVLVLVYNDRYRIINVDDTESVFVEIPNAVDHMQSLLDGR